MARILDPKTAANEIRDRVVRPNVAPDPLDQHSHNFVIAVCQELGVDPTPTNFTTVISALKDADIQPHQMVEYPKMLTDDKSKPVMDDFGRPVVFKSREEEDAYKDDSQQKHAAYPTVEDVTTKNPSVPNSSPGHETAKIEPEGKAPEQPAPDLPKR